MSDLIKKIEVYLGRRPDFMATVPEVRLRNDGNGDYIEEWNSTDKPQPTEEQLNALESQVQTMENNNQVIATRKKLYGSTVEQLEYIVENGVEAFIEKQNKIKSDNPFTK